MVDLMKNNLEWGINFYGGANTWPTPDLNPLKND